MIIKIPSFRILQLKKLPSCNFLQRVAVQVPYPKDYFQTAETKVRLKTDLFAKMRQKAEFPKFLKLMFGTKKDGVKELTIEEIINSARNEAFRSSLRDFHNYVQEVEEGSTTYFSQLQSLVDLSNSSENGKLEEAKQGLITLKDNIKEEWEIAGIELPASKSPGDSLPKKEGSSSSPRK